MMCNHRSNLGVILFTRYSRRATLMILLLTIVQAFLNKTCRLRSFRFKYRCKWRLTPVTLQSKAIDSVAGCYVVPFILNTVSEIHKLFVVLL